MSRSLKKLLLLPFSIMKKLNEVGKILWKCWVAAWKRRNICLYLLARRYCKIQEKTILWEAFNGRGILDNPKALFEAMLADPDFKDWKHIWVLDDLNNHVELIKRHHSKNVYFVKNQSVSHKFVLATAGTLMTNVAHAFYLSKRSVQTIVNTWHGIPLKGCGKEDKTQTLSTATYLLKNFLQADYLISASPFLSRIYQHSFQLNNTPYQKILEVGYPRLDTFKSKLRDQVFTSFSQMGVNIDVTKKVILYAPTFRGEYGAPETAIEPYLKLKTAIEDVIDTTQWQVLIKPHQIVYKTAREQFKTLDFMIPATIDANEVLSITDVLVSDFSSIFYDFLVTKRPIVFYIPDLEEYKASRGLYHSVDTLPGPVCQSLEELEKVFADVDAAVAPFAERYAEQRTWAGCDFDKGTNARTIMRHILLGEPATIAEKEPEKKKLLFTLPPRAKRQIVTTLITVLNKIDFTQYDVTLFTEGDKIGTLERLANELSKGVRILVRRGIFRTFIDEVRWYYYSKWGTGTRKGRKLLPKRYFQEEITRYLAHNTFDEVINVAGSSLFYTTFASLVPAKKRMVWAHDNLCEAAVTTQKHLAKCFGLYPMFDAVAFHCAEAFEANRAALPQAVPGGKCNVVWLQSLADVALKACVDTPPCCESRFDFSIIMAVYNVEPYLREAIESVVKQDIGFENHVQLILVDDGSPDGSGAICDEYAAKYPENILVIHKENGGVSSARNAGIDVATGTWLNFFDPDDKLSCNTLSKVKAFFDAHPGEVDVATIPVFFFEAIKGAHPTNGKFNKGSRIIYLLDEPEVVQNLCTTAFIKRDCIGDIRFSTNLVYAEDGDFIQKLLLRSPKLGVVAGCKYFYRKRKSDVATVQDNASNPKFYQTPRYFYLPYIEEAKRIFGEIPRFVACVLAYYLQWDLKSISAIPSDIGLSEEERKRCEAEYRLALKAADDGFIASTKNLYLEHKLAYFRNKYGASPKLQCIDEEAKITFNEVEAVFTYPFLQWHSMREAKGEIFLCVAFTQFTGLPEVTELIAKCDTTIFNARPLVCHEGSTFLNEPKFCRHLYEFEFKEADLPRTARLTFHFTQGGETYQAVKISRHFRFPLSNQFHAAYCILQKRCILARGAELIITTAYRHWKQELKLLLEIFKKRQGRWKEDLFIRVLRFVRQKLHCKPIWLLKDRAANADDNAEAMFIHLCEKHPEVNAYFVIDKTSPDGKRLERTGKICPFASRKNRILDALATVWLSSHSRSWLVPNEAQNHALRDFVALRPFIFLQHGIIQSYIGWCRRDASNFSGFVTTVEREWRSIIESAYGYSKREVWLTGLPRFDRLYHNEKRQIVIMPTWRQYFFEKLNPSTGTWIPRSGFSNTAYFNFYNSLLSHPRLLSAAKEFNYRLLFFAHPTMRLSGLADMFDCSLIEVLPGTTSYRDVYAESDLLLSDYSSALFDFVYLRKPILYAQFDKEEFFSGKHAVTRGYFDYERDGFGEVTYTLEETVDCLIDYMKNGCQLKDKYRERIDHFFAFNDQNNCERVYQKVCELIQQ